LSELGLRLLQNIFGGVHEILRVSRRRIALWRTAR